MNIYENLLKDIQPQEKKEFHAPMYKTIEYKISTLVDMMDNVDNLTDEDLKGIIIRQHSMILNYDPFLSNQENRKHAIKLFTNKRFLNVFLSIVNLLNLSREEIICVNKIAYDYYTFSVKDREISELLLNICYMLNDKTVIRLSANMDMMNARILSMISNSTFKAEKKVHRVNTFFLRKDTNKEFSVQDYIDIYLILFDHFKELFIYSMLEAWNVDKNTENEIIKIQYERFLKMSAAIMAMLDSLTSKDIQTVLRDYGYTVSLIKEANVRFSIKKMNGYERIKNIAYNLEAYEGDIIIP